MDTPKPSDSPIILGSHASACICHWDPNLIDNDIGGWYIAGPGEGFCLAAYSETDMQELITELDLSWRSLEIAPTST